MLKYLILVTTCAVTLNMSAQDLSGRVIEGTSKLPVPFASVFIVNTQLGVIADSLGYFEFKGSLPETFELKVSASLYETRLIRGSKGQELIIELEGSHQDLEDIIVSTPGGGFGDENPFHVDRLKVSDLNVIQSTTLGEALSNISGVQESSTGPGISKPVIRGLQGLRVLTMVNGVRMESQQWGGDHGLAISELGIGSVEVIKGPSSLLFGNDAFGGVIFLQDAPYIEQNSQSINISSRVESATLGSNSSLIYRVAKGNLRMSVAGLYSNYADYQLPSGSYVKDSRFKQQGGKFNLGYSKNNWVTHVRYTYSNSRVGIPGHSHDSVPKSSDFWVSVQNRSNNLPAQDVTTHIASWENKFFYKRGELALLVSNSNNNLSEYEEKVTIPGLKINNNSSYWKAAGVLQLNEKWSLLPGLQGIYQVNSNDPKAEEQLIPDFTQLDQGAYSLVTYKNKKWTFQVGGRVDIRSLNVGEFNFNKTYTSPNFSAGLVKAGKQTTVHFNVSSATRVPHVSELFSNGVHHGSLRYEVGDQDLKIEQAVQTDLNVEIHKEHLEVVINPYFNAISNFVGINPSDSIVDGYQVYNYEQYNQVSLYGGDIGLHYHPHFAHWLHFESSYSYVRAHDKVGNSMPLIPQARVNTFIKVAPETVGKLKIENVTLQHQYYFDQNNISFEEERTNAYNILNIAVNCLYDGAQKIRFGVGVKNLLNEEYINHLSRLKNINTPSVGRNFYISVNYVFKNKLKNI